MNSLRVFVPLVGAALAIAATAGIVPAATHGCPYGGGLPVPGANFIASRNG